ncbi:MAG TPA: glycosyltransferase family 4 protein [Tepidisphaeraceae bacterium]|nr:glycosyltransferase family 4 protein [Tepidisphaeraceae bacterium]
MKVLMTTDTVGGVWTYALDLIRALRPHGVEVALATMGAAVSSDQRAQLQRLENATLFESTFALEWMPDPWNDVREAGRWLLELEQTLQPDVIHLNGYAHGALPFEAPIVVVAHSCVLSWWQAVKGEAAPPEWDTYRRAVQEGLRGADAVVAPTAAMLECVHQHYGVLGNEHVIFNGRESAAYAVRTKSSFILSAGRFWDEAKNITALDSVAPHLTWPIYVAGDVGGQHGANGRWTTNVRSLGRLDAGALAKRMSRAAIYAMPARYEPFGLSILEAAMSGCALVIGDIPSLREVWGDAAVYVPPTDTAQLTDAIRELCVNEGRRATFAARATERAQRYTLSQVGDRYKGLYRQLTDSASFKESDSNAPGAQEGIACVS